MTVLIHKHNEIPELRQAAAPGEGVWVWMTWTEEVDSNNGILSSSWTLPDGWEDSNSTDVTDGIVEDEENNSYSAANGVYFVVPTTASSGRYKLTNTVIFDETPNRTVPRSVYLRVKRAL